MQCLISNRCYWNCNCGTSIFTSMMFNWKHNNSMVVGHWTHQIIRRIQQDQIVNQSFLSNYPFQQSNFPISKWRYLNGYLPFSGLFLVFHILFVFFSVLSIRIRSRQCYSNKFSNGNLLLCLFVSFIVVSRFEKVVVFKPNCRLALVFGRTHEFIGFMNFIRTYTIEIINAHKKMYNSKWFQTSCMEDEVRNNM